MKNLINWKLFFILTVVCTITALLVLPYSMALASSDAGITPIILLSVIAQNLVIFAVTVFLGLLISKRVGMGLPILEGALNGESTSREFKAILLPSIVLGAIAGVLIIIASIPFNRLIPEFANAEVASPGALRGFLASFYGGIAEEVLLRLFLVSLLVWITFLIKKTSDGRPTAFGVWLSIFLAAIIFGIGHLPATALIVDLTGIVILRAIILNGIGGIIFGWLYWKKGLESAIIAHFTADIVLHVITPFITGIMG